MFVNRFLFLFWLILHSHKYWGYLNVAKSWSLMNTFRVIANGQMHHGTVSSFLSLSLVWERLYVASSSTIIVAFLAIGVDATQQKNVDENKIEQCCSADNVHSCQVSTILNSIVTPDSDTRIKIFQYCWQLWTMWTAKHYLIPLNSRLQIVFVYR